MGGEEAGDEDMSEQKEGGGGRGGVAEGSRRGRGLRRRGHMGYSTCDG